jgi:hypothetical protein
LKEQYADKIIRRSNGLLARQEIDVGVAQKLNQLKA